VFGRIVVGMTARRTRARRKIRVMGIKSYSLEKNRLTESELGVCLEKWNDGDTSIVDEIIQSFSYLIYKISHKYTEAYPYLKQDIQSSATLWLIQGITWALGGRLSAKGFTNYLPQYISVTIKRFIFECIEAASFIRIPHETQRRHNNTLAPPKVFSLEQLQNDDHSDSFHPTSTPDNNLDALDLLNRLCLSPQEEQIFKLKGEGYKQKEIAAMLSCSAPNISYYVRNVLKRLERLVTNDRAD